MKTNNNNGMITIKCSKYNEVNFKDVKHLINNLAQIIKSNIQNGEFLDDIIISGYTIRVYSDDEIIINNVRLPLAKAPDSYFDKELYIN